MVELIVVIAIMAIAAVIAVPNLTKATSKADQNIYESYCSNAKVVSESFVNMLNMGETEYHVNGNNYEFIKGNELDESKLASAMNASLTQSTYRYMVTTSKTPGGAPSSAKTAAGTGVNARDVIIVCIVKNAKDSKRYDLVGMWYYNREKGKIVYTYGCLKSIRQGKYVKLS